MSYAFTWPILFSLLAAGYWFYLMNGDRESFSTAQIVGLLVATIVAIVLFVPGIFMVFMSTETNDAFLPMVLLVLMLGLLVP